MTKLQLFNKLCENQNLTNLFYPDAEDWMWNYCLNLGKFTDSEGINYDLGIYIDNEQPPMAACVYGNFPGSYNSGYLKPDEILNGQTRLEFYEDIGFEHYVETIKRATKLGLL